MAIVVKTNFFFEMLGEGWSETWYQLENGDLNDALNYAKEVARKRAALLANNARLLYVRCSDENVAGDSVVTGEIRQQGNEVDEKGECPFKGLVIRCETGANSRKIFCMRGLPKSVTSSKYRSSPFWAAWFRGFRVWAASIVTETGIIGLKALDKSETNPRVPITKIITDPDHPGYVRITAPGLANIANGTKVRLSGILYLPGKGTIRGVFNARFVAPGAFSVGGLLPAGAYTGKGYVWPRLYTVLPFDQCDIERVGSHKTGGVFGHARGRQKARA